MCVTPRTLHLRTVDGWFRPVELACRKCWQCRANRVNDWVGRAIAENEISTRSFFVTLTYGHTDRYGESLDERARSLHYSDVQRWLKRIRNAGYNVRYMIAGEYGPKKGRTHWHACLFFKGSVPSVKLGFKYWNTNESCMDPFWQDGNTLWEPFYARNAKYVCKYMLKMPEGRLGMARISRFPPLGHGYFAKRAEEFVRDGLSPQDYTYRFRDGKVTEYYLQGVSRDKFLEHFILKWREKHGRPSWPYSEIIEEYLHRKAEYERLPDPVQYKRWEPPYIAPPGGRELYVGESIHLLTASSDHVRYSPDPTSQDG